jgi:tetratricopeptide (TPR) repeat protein
MNPRRPLTGILFLLFCGVPAGATTVESYLHNRAALRQYGQKSYYPAYRDILQALESDPMNPVLHMNLGKIFEANEEYEKAEQAYQSALQLLPEGSQARFEALFNLGVAFGLDKKIDAALGAYQAALEIQPESKEVKTNIELLMQQQGGGGEGQDQQDDKEGKNDKEQKDQKDQKPAKPDQPKPKPKPKPFQSKELTPQDVKKILDEIKNQEQGIREKEYDNNSREAPRDKDW